MHFFLLYVYRLTCVGLQPSVSFLKSSLVLSIVMDDKAILHVCRTYNIFGETQILILEAVKKKKKDDQLFALISNIL